MFVVLIFVKIFKVIFKLRLVSIEFRIVVLFSFGSWILDFMFCDMLGEFVELWLEYFGGGNYDKLVKEFWYIG